MLHERLSPATPINIAPRRQTFDSAHSETSVSSPTAESPASSIRSPSIIPTMGQTDAAARRGSARCIVKRGDGGTDGEEREEGEEARGSGAAGGSEVDAALKKAWADELHQLKANERGEMAAWDAMWEAVAAIANHRPPLYLAGGFADFRAFLRAYLPEESERSASRNMRVAQFASPDEEEKYTVTKIANAIDYLATKFGPIEGRLPVDFEKLRIPVRIDGARVVKRFVDCNKDQIAAAKRELERGRRPTKSPPAVKAVSRALAAKPLASIRVSLSGGKLTLSGIELAALPALARALARLDPAALRD